MTKTVYVATQEYCGKNPLIEVFDNYQDLRKAIYNRELKLKGFSEKKMEAYNLNQIVSKTSTHCGKSQPVTLYELLRDNGFYKTYKIELDDTDEIHFFLHENQSKFYIRKKEKVKSTVSRLS